jgi:hypothetical protein
MCSDPWAVTKVSIFRVVRHREKVRPSHALPLRVARVRSAVSALRVPRSTAQYLEYLEYLEYRECLRVRRSESRAEISVAVALQDCAIAKKFIEKFKHSKKVLALLERTDRTAYH